MSTVQNSEQHSQAPANDSPTREQAALLRHALTNGAAVIAALLCDDPTPADARMAARAWLRTWEAYKLAGIEKNAAELTALAGGAR